MSPFVQLIALVARELVQSFEWIRRPSVGRRIFSEPISSSCLLDCERAALIALDRRTVEAGQLARSKYANESKQLCAGQHFDASMRAQIERNYKRNREASGALARPLVCRNEQVCESTGTQRLQWARARRSICGAGAMAVGDILLAD